MAPMLVTGARVVVIKGGAQRPGTVTEVRWETYLRPYVVQCDDGGQVFASACDVALEGDPTSTAIGPAVEP